MKVLNKKNRKAALARSSTRRGCREYHTRVYHAHTDANSRSQITEQITERILEMLSEGATLSLIITPIKYVYTTLQYEDF